MRRNGNCNCHETKHIQRHKKKGVFLNIEGRVLGARRALSRTLKGMVSNVERRVSDLREAKITDKRGERTRRERS